MNGFYYFLTNTNKILTENQVLAVFNTSVGTLTKPSDTSQNIKISFSFWPITPSCHFRKFSKK